MNKVNNKRRRESQEKIEKTFIELIQTNEINKILVSDICKLTNLNRSTFYANYIDIYDLADKLKEKLENELKNVYKDEIINSYNSNDYLKLFIHIKENQLFYKTYFRLGYDNNVKIISYDKELAKRHFNNEFIDYHIEFFKSGLNSIIKKWLNNNCKETPEEINDIIKKEYRSRII